MLATTNRHRLARGAIGLVLMRTLLSCHAYVPQRGAPPAGGTRVQVRFAEQRAVVVRFGDGDSTVRTVRSITGRVRSVEGDTLRLYELSTVYARFTDGRDIPSAKWSEGSAALPMAGAQVAVERLVPVRTAVVVVGGVATIVLLAVLAFGGSGDSAPGSGY